MYVHSAWLQTAASHDQLVAFADQLGEPADVDPPDVGAGELTVRAVTYADNHESAWRSAESTGTRFVVLAELPATDEDTGERLIGLVGQSAGLVNGLVDELEGALREAGTAYERTQFSLRNLLAPPDHAEVRPTSVRVSDERTTTLVQSEDEYPLREELSGRSGDVVGVTVQSGEQQVTVLIDGSVVFTESASMSDVLTAMRAIQEAMTVPQQMVMH
ncbi:hypothetical protein AB0L70_33685 [Kribbella sp. NPDC051952]|uniref:hypothetical protein n=1 Tax=Kribbella sp. NPDC051952 TaxID=3154851 RepID=UPI003420302B